MTEDATTLPTAEGCAEFPSVERRVAALRGGIPGHGARILVGAAGSAFRCQHAVDRAEDHG